MAFWHKVRGRTWVSEQILGFFQSWWLGGVGDLAVGLFREHGELQAQTPGVAADPLLDFLAEGSRYTDVNQVRIFGRDLVRLRSLRVLVAASTRFNPAVNRSIRGQVHRRGRLVRRPPLSYGRAFSTCQFDVRRSCRMARRAPKYAIANRPMPFTVNIPSAKAPTVMTSGTSFPSEICDRVAVVGAKFQRPCPS